MYREKSTGMVALVLFLIFSIQLFSKPPNNSENKIWQTQDIDVIRSLYRGNDGQPSRNVFLSQNGLSPTHIQYEAIPCFRSSFKVDDVEIKNNTLLVKPGAKPVQTDFYITYKKTFFTSNIAIPVWDVRIYEQDRKVIVGGYSSKYNERPVAVINRFGDFEQTLSNDLAAEFPVLSIPLENLLFDPFEWRLYHVQPGLGKEITEQYKDFLPISVANKNHQILDDAHFTIRVEQDNSIHCYLLNGTTGTKIASCTFDSPLLQKIEGYQPKLIKGCVQPEDGKVITLVFKGVLEENIEHFENMLIIDSQNQTTRNEVKPEIVIDGYFDEWRNVRGVDDPEGDYVSYLYPNPDTDILEFKVSHDDQYLYFYSRIAGAHGRTGPTGRYYWYTYIDVDADPNTGYPPTRDDNCYFGIAIGDDSEAQFEFVGNSFIKTFFGFTGVGTEKEALEGKLNLGPSYYSATAPNGDKRDRYKVEYVNREGSRFITHDNTPGTSEDIVMALSADGSEMEMRVEMKGFLTNVLGEYLVKKGNTINIAVGAEGASGHYNSGKWGADSSPVIYNYTID